MNIYHIKGLEELPKQSVDQYDKKKLKQVDAV